MAWPDKSNRRGMVIYTVAVGATNDAKNGAPLACGTRKGSKQTATAAVTKTGTFRESRTCTGGERGGAEPNRAPRTRIAMVRRLAVCPKAGRYVA